jgi:hypothetical protein
MSSGRTAATVDIVSPELIAGWAVFEGQAALVAVRVNGRAAGTVSCRLARPDLTAHGLPGDCGFRVAFDPRLTEEDRLDLRFGPFAPP